MSRRRAAWLSPPVPIDGCCPACGKWVARALAAEPPQWACVDIDCVHGRGHPMRPAQAR